MFINRESIHNVRPCPVIKEKDLRFTRSAENESTVYVFIPQGRELWKHGERREYTLESLLATDKTRISVLGQNDKVVEYQPDKVPDSRLEQTENGLKISVVRAQRIYNDRTWPNPVVVKLENVKFR